MARRRDAREAVGEEPRPPGRLLDPCVEDWSDELSGLGHADPVAVRALDGFLRYAEARRAWLRALGVPYAEHSTALPLRSLRFRTR